MFLSGLFLLLVFAVQFIRSSTLHKMHKMKPSDILEVPVCKHRTYCEDTSYYPTDIVLDALEKNPHLRFYANTDEIDAFESVDEKPEEEPLCISMEQIIFPKSGETNEKEWKYIVNHENFTQSVRIEMCLEEDTPCRVIEGFAEGYYTKCKQKYIYRQLLAIAPDGSINREYFRFPASCCCHVEFKADQFLRSFHSKH